MTITDKPAISGKEFCTWLKAMNGMYGHNDAQCAKLLGVSPQTIVAMKASGIYGHCAHRTRLAMTALALNRQPWPFEKQP